VEPDRHDAYTVFAQHSLELSALRAQAERFFAAKIGFAANGDVMIAREPIKATRRCIERPADPGDWAAAEAAERAQNTYGMSLLAQRCRTVWLVVRESDDDPAALLIATVFASTLLGPILAPSGNELFGVRSARVKLGLV
jgi:hypothetical protein